MDYQLEPRFNAMTYKDIEAETGIKWCRIRHLVAHRDMTRAEAVLFIQEEGILDRKTPSHRLHTFGDDIAKRFHSVQLVGG